MTVPAVPVGTMVPKSKSPLEEMEIGAKIFTLTAFVSDSPPQIKVKSFS